MASIILKNKYLPLKLPNLTPDCSSNSAPFQTKLAQIPYLLMPQINITDRTHIIMHPLLSPSPTTTVTTVLRITLDGVRKPSSCLSAFLRRERLQDTFVVSDWTLGKQQPEHQQRMLACLWLLCLQHLKSVDSWSKFFFLKSRKFLFTFDSNFKVPEIQLKKSKQNPFQCCCVFPCSAVLRFPSCSYRVTELLLASRRRLCVR